jgi:8-amino-7-oxononanoate synthase
MGVTTTTFFATTALQQQLEKRSADNQLRTLNTHLSGIDFFSNDYLGFAKSTVIKKNAEQLFNTLNNNNINGSTGSRLISGTGEFVLALEKQIAEFHSTEAALIYNSGFDANIGLFSSIASRNDTVLYDELIHASIIDGIRLSNANRFKFKHNDLADLERLLQKTKGIVYVAVESVYSMDGDSSPLTQLVQLCQQYGANLIVDEAHATGIFGKNGVG